jgi:cell shape-determining protein MreC
MAQDRVKYFELFAPDGSGVSVAGEERAKLLQEQRGYTKSKPRNPKVPAYLSDQQARDKELADLRAENERLKAAASAVAEDGSFAPPQTPTTGKK